MGVFLTRAFDCAPSQSFGGLVRLCASIVQFLRFLCVLLSLRLLSMSLFSSWCAPLLDFGRSAFVRRMTCTYVCSCALLQQTCPYPLFCTHFAARRLTRLGLEPLPPCSMPWADRLPAPVQVAFGAVIASECAGSAGCHWHSGLPCGPAAVVSAVGRLGCRLCPRVCRQCSLTLALVGSRSGAV